VPWESAFDSLGVHECWSVFKNHLSEAQQQAIPLCHKSNKQGRRPAWLNREVLMELKRKKKFISGSEVRLHMKTTELWFIHTGRRHERPKFN